MKVYIAGPMTGIEGFNYPAFNAAEDELRSIGHEPINPARRGVEPDWSWADYMRHAIRDVTNAEAIHLLDGWESSKGAQLEATIADALGLVRIGRESIA
jgi:hypothetical protein